MSKLLPTGAALLVLLPAVALSQGLLGDDAPPQNARPLSQLLQQVESRPEFAYIKDIEWDDDTYQIEYQTKEGDEEEIEIDPATGKIEE
jgi:uncharacterized membrane protein YkoI